MAKVIHRGRVTDEQGQPLWGAHIVTLNSTPKRAATTDVNGNFTVDGNIGESWQITYIGFKPINLTLKAVNVDKTYRMVESAEQLNEVTVTPRPKTPVKTKNPWDIGGFLSDIGSVFTGASQSIATPPILPNNGLTTTGQQGQVYVPPTPGNGGLLQWLKDNPMWTGIIVLAAIAGTGYVLSKKEEKAKDKPLKKKLATS
jgi:hypothetical protein